MRDICAGRAWREGKGEDQVTLKGLYFQRPYVSCFVGEQHQGVIDGMLRGSIYSNMRHDRLSCLF